MVNGSSGLVVETSERLLTASEFQNLANVPPEVEWFANIENANTRLSSLLSTHLLSSLLKIQILLFHKLLIRRCRRFARDE